LLPIEFEMKIDANLVENGPGLFPSIEAAMKKVQLKLKLCSFVYNYEGIGLPDE